MYPVVIGRTPPARDVAIAKISFQESAEARAGIFVYVVMAYHRALLHGVFLVDLYGRASTNSGQA